MSKNLCEWFVVLFLDTKNTGGGRDLRQKIKGLKSLALLSLGHLRDSGVFAVGYSGQELRRFESSAHR